MSAALAGRSGADCRRHRGEHAAGGRWRPDRGVRPLPRASPTPAAVCRRARAHGAAGKPARLAPLALVAASLSLHPCSTRAAPARSRALGSIRRASVFSPGAGAGVRRHAARTCAGGPSVGALHPQRAGYSHPGRRGGLRDRVDRLQDPARARACARRYPARRAGCTHGRGLSRHVADAVHRYWRVVAATFPPPAVGCFKRRYRHRTGTSRAVDAGLGAAGRRRVAPGGPLSGNDRLGAHGVAQCQPVHALRWLFHPV